MRELLLMRHGKSLRIAGGDDSTRPLKDAGKRGAQRMGVHLAKHALIPDHFVSSPAERAAATAAKCTKAMQMDARQLVLDRRIQRGRKTDLLTTLAACPADAQRVLLVGHNPGLKKLARLLLPDDQVIDRLPKASLLRIRLPDNWSQLEAGQGALVEFIDVADLPKKFPFPSPQGTELRDRPAYYYTQSSVVPYRMDRAQLEILIVRSSQKKHWVVPKGIADPGLSLQASAEKEAWEEAGVVGEVNSQPIGSYSYEKWGATCTVSVYPMRVTRVVPDEEWEERYRGRQWVSARVASMLIRQPALGELITAFDRMLSEGHT